MAEEKPNHSILTDMLSRIVHSPAPATRPQLSTHLPLPHVLKPGGMSETNTGAGKGSSRRDFRIRLQLHKQARSSC